jgi:hypothetical protein
MSEQLPSSENRPGASHYEHLPERETKLAKLELRAAVEENKQQRQLEAARETLSQTAETQTAPAELTQAPVVPKPTHISKELRSLTVSRTLTSIQNRLPAPDRLASRFVHQPVVKHLSEASAKTVGRPLPLLSGGLFAFLGTTTYLLFARYVGIEYNHTIWLLLFAAGFICGLCLDLLRQALKRRH